MKVLREAKNKYICFFHVLCLLCFLLLYIRREGSGNTQNRGEAREQRFKYHNEAGREKGSERCRLPERSRPGRRRCLGNLALVEVLVVEVEHDLGAALHDEHLGQHLGRGTVGVRGYSRG